MDVLDAIEKMLKDTGKTKAGLASDLGRSKQSVTNMFAKGTDVYTDTLANMAKSMGYDLILRSKDKEIVITPRSKEQ